MKGQWGKLVGYFLLSLLVAAAGTLGLPLIGGGSWLPDTISTEGAAIDSLFWGLVILCLIIFAIVAAIVVYSIVHFRAEPGDLSDGVHIHGNAKMEVVWIMVPTIIVTVIAIFSWQVLADNEIGLFDSAKANATDAAKMVVDVHAFSFGWNFRYESTDGKVLTQKDVLPSSDLVLPLDVVVRFNVMSCTGREALGRVREEEFRRLSAGGADDEFAKIDKGRCEKEWDSTSNDDRAEAVKNADLVYSARQKIKHDDHLTDDEREAVDAEPKYKGDQQYVDVNHAFWVPEARLKIDAVSGLPTYVQWTPNRITKPSETYQVVCAELCGAGHNTMRTPMCIVSESDFEWYLGLAVDDAQQATCINLRLLSCIKAPGDRTAALGKLATLSQGKPNATCHDANKAVAA
ncbi:MAG: cytochrome c oxidase, subunit [Thermoleophilia bacterium]|nr:cytochrome c oxidase, subunit [Thermoleophilia bacterium]